MWEVDKETGRCGQKKLGRGGVAQRAALDSEEAAHKCRRAQHIGESY